MDAIFIHLSDLTVRVRFCLFFLMLNFYSACQMGLLARWRLKVYTDSVCNVKELGQIGIGAVVHFSRQDKRHVETECLLRKP